MFPTRRNYLRRIGLSVFGVAFAGCTAAMPPRADGGGPRVTLLSVTDTSDFPVQPSIEVTRPNTTGEHPPQFRTTLTNTTNTSVWVGEARSAHFEYMVDESREFISLPYDTDDRYPAEPGCWRLTDAIGASADFKTVEVPPGEPTTRLIELYGFREGEGCLPTGTFRFETSMSLFSRRGVDPGPSARWAFEIRVA